MTAPKITLHWLNESRSQRVAWLLEELNLPYDIKVYLRNEQTLAPPELEKVHPLGKAPAVEIDGKTLTESGYIMDYIMRTLGKGSDLEPKNEEDQEKVKYFLHFTEGSFSPFLVMLLVSEKVREAKVSFFLKGVATKVVDQMDEGYAAPNTKKNYAYLESELAKNGSGYFVGSNLTAADIMISYPLFSVRNTTNYKKNYPNIDAFLKLVENRPAYKRAAERTQNAHAQAK